MPLSTKAGAPALFARSTGRLTSEYIAKMKLSNKTAGIVVVVGAPFLFINMCADNPLGSGHIAPGICDLLYIVGWLCSIIGLMNLEAIGNQKWGNNLLRLSFVFLSIACIGNLWNQELITLLVRNN